MKSIKEEAEEHLRENNITQYKYKSYIEGAGFGANYVLDAIEDILTNPRRYVNPVKSVEEGVVDDIIKCIEQLKDYQ